MPIQVIAILLGILVGATLIAAAAGVAALRSPEPVLRRLGLDAPGSEIAVPSRDAIIAKPLARAGLTGGVQDGASRLRRQLTWAGFRGESAPHIFLLFKLVLPIVTVVAFAAINAARVEPIQRAVPIAFWLSVGAFFLPNLWLHSRVAARQRQIERALPDALDLLVTCVEAGLGLDAAMQRVADEIALAWPLLSRELRLAFLEVKAGIPRMDAFRRLAERTGCAELRSLSATLNQTEMFGTSVGSALRVQADGIRVRRMQRAEEKAASVAVKMTFPLILFILPSLFVVVVGPAIIAIGTKLLPALGAH